MTREQFNESTQQDIISGLPFEARKAAYHSRFAELSAQEQAEITKGGEDFRKVFEPVFLPALEKAITEVVA